MGKSSAFGNEISAAAESRKGRANTVGPMALFIIQGQTPGPRQRKSRWITSPVVLGASRSAVLAYCPWL